MVTITIQKNIAHGQDLIAISCKEYEILKRLKKPGEFVATPVQKRALAEAEKNLARGNTLSYHELVRKLGFTN